MIIFCRKPKINNNMKNIKEYFKNKIITRNYSFQLDSDKKNILNILPDKETNFYLITIAYDGSDFAG